VHVREQEVAVVVVLHGNAAFNAANPVTKVQTTGRSVTGQNSWA